MPRSSRFVGRLAVSSRISVTSTTLCTTSTTGGTAGMKPTRLTNGVDSRGGVDSEATAQFGDCTRPQGQGDCWRWVGRVRLKCKDSRQFWRLTGCLGCSRLAKSAAGGSGGGRDNQTAGFGLGELGGRSSKAVWSSFYPPFPMGPILKTPIAQTSCITRA